MESFKARSWWILVIINQAVDKPADFQEKQQKKMKQNLNPVRNGEYTKYLAMCFKGGRPTVPAPKEVTLQGGKTVSLIHAAQRSTVKTHF